MPANSRASSTGLWRLKPEDRYPTAAALQDDLEAYLEGLPERTSPRDIGKYLIETFADQRLKVKTVIEAQLSDVRWSGAYPAPTTSALPKIDLGTNAPTPSGVLVSSPRTPAPPQEPTQATRLTSATTPSGATRAPRRGDPSSRSARE